MRRYLNNFAANPTIKNNVFINNTAVYGGAIINDGENLNITNSTFIDNIGAYNGWAIHKFGNYTTITDLYFINNSNNKYFRGGTISNGGRKLTIINSKFINYKASTTADALYNYPQYYFDHPIEVIIIDSYFINNSTMLVEP